MNSHDVEFSIAGCVGEMVRDRGDGSCRGDGS